MDAVLQACLLWVKEQKQSASLPLKIEKWQQFKSLDAGENFTIHLKVVEENKHKLVCDIDCFNNRGELCAQFKSAEVTISKNLKQKFAS